jgi:hypothetical protein
MAHGPRIAVLEWADKTINLYDRISKLADLEVLVGVPEEKSERKAGNINNAQIAFVQSHGSPMQGIPARPFIEPAIEDSENKAAINSPLERAASLALDGDLQGTRQALKEAGVIARNAVQGWFVNPKNGWPPLSPSTIEARARKKFKISKYKLAKTKAKYRGLLAQYIETGIFNPLIDTGQLRGSINYVVRNKGD